MARRIREHVRANVVSYIALFCFAMGGTAEAVDGPLAGQDTVGSADIIGGEVLSEDIGDGRIFNNDVADNIIQSNRIQDATLLGADVASGTLTNAHIDESTLFNDNSLDTADIDESTLFNDNSLTQADLAANSIAGQEVASSSVGSSEVSSVGGAELPNSSVGTSELASESVTAAELTEVSSQRFEAVLGAFETKDFLVACPSGTLIGGDVSALSRDVRLNASMPSESTTAINFPEDGDTAVAWWGRFQNTVVFNRDVRVFAICHEPG